MPKDYDYESAESAGLGPGKKGHWPSRVPSGPKRGLILKPEGHKTFGETLKGEAQAGMTIYRKGGRLYSFPKNRKVGPEYKPYEVPTTLKKKKFP